MSEDVSPASPSPSSTETPLSVRFEACGHGNAVLATLNHLRHNGELCDVVLKVENKEFNIHKVVLSANSPYFHAMFTSSYTEASQSAIELHDITAAALEAIICYFYTSEVYISTDNVQELLPVASMLQITALREACCEFMTRHLGIANCLGVRAFADTHSCSQLKTIAEEFAKEHFREVVRSEEFLRLQVDQVVALLSADDLNIQSEEKVYEAMIAWVKHDPANRDKHIADLLEKVRLPLLPPSFLCDRVSQEGTVKGNQRAMGLLLQAMEYHLLPERQASFSNALTRPRRYGSRRKVILAVGGMGRREPTASIEQFDPHMGQWRSLSPMLISRWGAGVASLEGMVYVVGGSSESSRLSSAERYNVSCEQWSSLPEMSAARNGVGVIAAGGLLYALGGFDGVSPLKSAEQYDSHTNRWTAIPSMNTKRFGLGACICEGIIYALGGSDGSNLSTAECYNISLQTWSPIAPMHLPRKFPGAEALGGMVYAIGGCDATNRHSSVERYVPGLNQWTVVASLLNPRSGLGTAVLNGFLYAVGGYDGGGYLASVERYDPLTNEWTSMPSMAVGRDCVGVTMVEIHQTNPDCSS